MNDGPGEGTREGKLKGRLEHTREKSLKSGDGQNISVLGEEEKDHKG